MTGKILIPAASLIFLAGAVLSGASVSGRIQVDTFHHVEAVGSGFQRLKHFVASAIYLQLDDYHHIEMYQGIDWREVTDYLPQMWLIAKLDPHFTDVYTDASFHLAVNLGRVEEGMEFIREGLSHNPDSLNIRFQYAYLLWETGSGTPDEIIRECLAYRDLMRRNQGDDRQPYGEGSSATLLGLVFENIPDLSEQYSAFYSERQLFILTALGEGLYYPEYLGEPPPFLNQPLKEERQ